MSYDFAWYLYGPMSMPGVAIAIWLGGRRGDLLKLNYTSWPGERDDALLLRDMRKSAKATLTGIAEHGLGAWQSVDH